MDQCRLAGPLDWIVTPEIELQGGERLRAFIARAGRGGVQGIRVGFFSEARYADADLTPVASVAASNEFGVTEPGRNIPERPFFRRATREMDSDLIDAIKGGIDPTRMVVTQRLADLLGAIAQSHIQRQIETSDSWAVPNSPVTIARKGSSGPLRDTGLMRNSVTWVVDR